MLLAILLSVIFGGLHIYIFLLNRKSHDYPPGPFRWPIFGNLLQVGVEPHKTVMGMRKKYGDIIAIDLGTRRAVFINEHKLLKEAFSNPAFSGRCQMKHFFEPKSGLPRGMVFTSGKIWAEQRKFVFSYIHGGFRNETAMETLVIDEISKLIKDLQKLCGKSIDTKHIFNISAINALWVIVAGKKCSLDDPDFTKMIKHNTRILRSKLVQGLLLFYPRISEMFPKLSGYQKLKENAIPMFEFMQNIIDEHKRTYQEGIERDLVDAYLHKIDTTTDPNSSFYGETGAMNLRYVVQGLFTAGTETVSTMLTWIVFLVAHHPQIQKKLICCIKLQCENRRQVSLKDRPRLPYVEAVIMEVLRFSSVAPLGLFRETLEDVNLRGYRLPKGTVIVSNQYGMMHDPDVWGDPENFRPCRFLSEDGKEIIRHGGLVAFSAGLRGCPGESFARDELFLFTTSLFQNFEIEFDPSYPIPPIKSTISNIVAPVDHKMLFHKLIG